MNAIIPTTDMPHNVEAEQMLLGALLANNENYHRISDFLTDEHFYDPVHARVFATCASRIRAGHLASPVSLKVALEHDEGLAQLGGPGYLVRCVGAASSSHIKHYALLIVDVYKRRKLLESLEQAKDTVLSGGDVLEAQAGVMQMGELLMQNDQGPRTKSWLAACTGAIQGINDRYQGQNLGLMSGIKSLDDLTGGFFPGDFVVIPAAPSMGKTTVGLALAKCFAEQGHGTCVVSLEMDADSLANRLLASMANVPYRSMRRADISEDDFRNIVGTAQKTQGWPLVITPPRIRSVESIYAELSRVKQSMEGSVPGGLRVVFVDYLQLVRSKGKDEVEIVANASRAMKSWALMFGITVVALAQVSRSVADRDDKRPRMNDIRGSAQIEQDADVIAMVHRDHYYLEREGPPRNKHGRIDDNERADYEAALSASRRQMDIILAKHRHDGIGEVKLGCDMATNRIWDLQRGDQASFAM